MAVKMVALVQNERLAVLEQVVRPRTKHVPGTTAG